MSANSEAAAPGCRLDHQAEAKTGESLENWETSFHGLRIQHGTIRGRQSNKSEHRSRRGRRRWRTGSTSLFNNEFLNTGEIGGGHGAVLIRVGAFATRDQPTLQITRARTVTIVQFGDELNDVGCCDKAVAVCIAGIRELRRPCAAGHPYHPAQCAKPPKLAAIFGWPPHDKTRHYAQCRYQGQPHQPTQYSWRRSDALVN